MTLQTLNAPMVWPDTYLAPDAAPAIGNTTVLDAAGEYHALVLQARQSMTISHVGFLSSSAGSATAEIRIETVDTTTGLPTGTLWAANTNATTATLTTNVWELTALTASASISAGQVYCVKIAYASGTSVTLRHSVMFDEPQATFPYAVVNTGTPTITAIISAMHWAIGSGSTSFYNVWGMVPAVNAGLAQNAFNNTNSAARGLRFQIPFTGRCVGMLHFNSNTTGDFNYLLLDDAGSELSSSSTAFDGNINAALTTSIHILYFDNPVTLSSGTWYRAAVEPSSATNINISTLQVPSADYRSATPYGTNAHYATRASGSWTDTATNTLPLMQLLFDQLDDGAGSGGGGSKPGAGLHRGVLIG